MSTKHQHGNKHSKPQGKSGAAAKTTQTPVPARVPTVAPPPSPPQHSRQQVHLLRITLQLESPLALGSGHATSEFDSPCALDANGLPYLPGTSLAGSLRAWLGADAEDWFGYVDMGNDGEHAGKGLTSPIRLTSGHIHNARDEVQDGRVLLTEWQKDAILGPLASTLPHREHVRLNHRGVGADTGKFDRSFVPRGHRFTFQLQITPYLDDAQRWPVLRQQLLEKLASGTLCLGGAQRAGFGRVRAVRAWDATLDLRDAAQRSQLSAWRRLEKAPPVRPVDLPKAASLAAQPQRDVPLNLPLTACDYWRVGSAANGLRAPGLTSDVPDDQPYREHFVNWTPVPAALDHAWVVPGSALKGALAHRTAFHLNRLEQRWAGQVDECAPLEAVHALFGMEARDDASLRSAGAVWVDDALPTGTPGTPQVVRFNHVRLDRFTGGAYGGALFTGEALFGGQLCLQLRLRVAALHQLCPDAAGQQRVLTAFMQALSDLARSQLAIGADAANGLGYFTASNAPEAAAQLQAFEHTVKTALAALTQGHTTDETPPQALETTA